MNTAVLDASVATRWFVEDALHDQAIALRGDYACIAPALLLTEVANALWKYVRPSRLSLDAAMDNVTVLADEFALVEDRSLIRAAQRLSSENNHPVYDCLYIALARQEGVPLITADGKLVRKLGGLPGLEVIELSGLVDQKAR